MVALSPPNVVFNAVPDPSIVRVITVEIRKASAGDTIDVASQLALPRAAVFFGSTANVRAVATVAGTIVTLPAGLANDSGYLIVLGTSP